MNFFFFANPVQFPTLGRGGGAAVPPRAADFEPTFPTQFLLVHRNGLPLRESPISRVLKHISVHGVYMVKAWNETDVGPHVYRKVAPQCFCHHDPPHHECGFHEPPSPLWCGFHDPLHPIMNVDFLTHPTPPWMWISWPTHPTPGTFLGITSWNSWVGSLSLPFGRQLISNKISKPHTVAL